MRPALQRRIPTLLGLAATLAAAVLWRRAVDRRQREVERRTLARLRPPTQG